MHKASWLGSTVGRYPMSNGLCLMSQGCSPTAQDRQEPRRRTPYMAALYNLYRYIVQHLLSKSQPLVYIV
jgi:hypothetical protein